MSNVKIERIKHLVKILNHASNEYYNSDKPLISDYDWDRQFDELKQLEEETGCVFSNSPTQNVGYSVVNEITKVKHNHPMLSLDKTKSVNDLRKFASNNQCILSVKCDGLSLSLHYNNGELVSAETRGNGNEGSDVLNNVLTIKNIPYKIPYTKDLIIDGEVIIGWDAFNTINERLPEDQKYKHPRNLVSGSLTLLDSKEAADRKMRFIAWRVIKGFQHESVFRDLKEAEKNGFEVVPLFTYVDRTDGVHIDKMVNKIQEMADDASIPYDGAVMAIDDYKLAESMGRTDKFYRHSIAYKYEDELYETILRNIGWSTSKTGLINPIAIFDPVDLDGAITARATLHNITYIKNMMLGIGDRIRIYRSNKVIPKVHDSIDKSGNFTIPSTCPICGKPTKIVKQNDSEVLMCTNDDCPGKLLGKLSHAASKNALNIDGLSDATIQKFIDLRWLTKIKDIYNLETHKKEMSKLEGFGSKSVNKLLTAIENSRNTNLTRFLYAQSIPLIGHTASKDIAKYSNNSLDQFRMIVDMDDKPFIKLDGFGEERSKSIKKWWNTHHEEFCNLAQEFYFEKEVVANNSEVLKNKVFVITGSVHHFANRDALKNKIESLGGKVSGSVSAKTSYLINNDNTSKSSKNVKAMQLNIPIITEDDFLNMIGE